MGHHLDMYALAIEEIQAAVQSSKAGVVGPYGALETIQSALVDLEKSLADMDASTERTE